MSAEMSSAAVPPVPLYPPTEERQPSLAEHPLRATADTLPTLVSGSRATGWWGILMLVTIETVVVTSLIASYFYLRTSAPRWPLGGIEPPELFLPLISTSILILSVAPMYWSVWAVKRDKRIQLLIALALVVIMGIVFLVLKYVEYSEKEYIWSTNAYGSIVWMLVGFHATHLIAAVLKSLAMFITAWRGYFNRNRHVGLQGNSLYWYFVVIIWIPLFLTIYIAPRVM